MNNCCTQQKVYTKESSLVKLPYLHSQSNCIQIRKVLNKLYSTATPQNLTTNQEILKFFYVLIKLTEILPSQIYRNENCKAYFLSIIVSTEILSQTNYFRKIHKQANNDKNHKKLFKSKSIELI